MMTKLRFVFDTNVAISAVLLKKSVSRRAFDKARANGKLLISTDTLNELQQVLQREKFQKYITEQERTHRDFSIYVPFRIRVQKNSVLPLLNRITPYQIATHIHLPRVHRSAATIDMIIIGNTALGI